MDLRNHYADSANHAAYAYMRYIEQLEQNTHLRDALDSAPVEITKGRRLSDIVLDDMMDRFTTVMAAASNEDSIPSSFYHYLFRKRVGDDVSISDQEIEANMLHDIERQRYNDAPATLPTFLEILEPHLSIDELASLTNNWNDLFKSVVGLATSDDGLRIHSRNIATQNAMVKVANNGILLKQTGGRGKVSPGMSGNGNAKGHDGDDDEDENELDVLTQRLAALDMPTKARETVDKLIRRTAKMPAHMNERHTNIKRLELIADLPWNNFTQTTTDLQTAEDVLNDEHYGLEKVKERILRHVAVQIHTAQTQGKIICLVGPPGVGKTSIAQSVAKALGRNYGRISLGGVHDESKIRGHSSTYVGALPGIILQGMKEAKSGNPLLVLDEIDKMGQDARRGDPTAAMLEVLDPAQNHSFRDDFAGIEYDISKVFYFATANDLSTIPGPLRDRMQIIQLPGYQPEEKFEIATRYLLPKQMKNNGLNADNFSVEPEVIKALISNYTREAGVRGLEGKINEICTTAVLKIVKGHEGPVHVTKDDLKEYVGIAYGGQEMIADEDQIGVVNGLSYSSVGGGVLPIEVNRTPSNGGFKVTATGRLGEVMGESVSVAKTLVNVRAPQFGIRDELINKAELHVHAPDGAVPKDGPSAGAAFTTAIVSSLTGIPIRRDVAMTGEINSRGQVTAIGGLPEKLQGAQAAGVKTVLIPKENEPHLEEVAANVRAQLEIIPVSTIEEVLHHALTEALTPLPAPQPVERSWRTRLRDAWGVMRQASNDNTPQAVPLRQPAGPRRKTPGDFTP